jgi:uncharacterized protein (DUF433 family)
MIYQVQELKRITIITGGKPWLRGMRVTVWIVVDIIAAGRTVPADFPYLE